MFKQPQMNKKNTVELKADVANTKVNLRIMLKRVCYFAFG